MPDTAIQVFEGAVAGLQRTAITGHYKNGISTAQFADIMFQIANLLGSVECRPADESRLCFGIGDDMVRTYEFPVSRIFRSLLGSIAELIWSQSSGTPKHELFNAYGDKRQIRYTNANGVTAHFQVETANTNGEPLYFAIRRLK